MRKVYIILSVIGIALLIIFGLRPISKKTEEKVKFNIKKEQISAIVVPHFNFAKEKRRGFLKELSRKISPEKIVIVSVNHFNSGQADIATTAKRWIIKDASPKTNSELFKELTLSGLAKNEEVAFSAEHGISEILPDLAAFFPNAVYLPIIIKDNVPKEKVSQLASGLKIFCPECLLVASIDFSHYNPDSLAQIHDEMGLSALFNLNEEKAWAAETDSPQTFHLAIDWAKLSDTSNFYLYHHSNSGQETNNPDMETTSYILGYYSNEPPTAPRPKTSTFIFAGDMMYNRHVYQKFKEKGLTYIFDRFGSRVFRGVDLSLANLEGPISSTPIPIDIRPGKMTFRFPPETPKVLDFIGLNAISLGNNHTLNAGRKEFETTKELLSRQGILFVGGQDFLNEESILRIEAEIPLSIIAFNQLEDNFEEQTVAAIKKEKSANRFVIIYPHWGYEYQQKHSKIQEKLAHLWIDDGADLVVGSHPHVVQDFEIYKNKPIVYSLGNFVFDQYFSKETQESLLVGGIIAEENLQLSFFPVKLPNSMPELEKGKEKEARINKLLNIDNSNTFTRIRGDTVQIERE